MLRRRSLPVVSHAARDSWHARVRDTKKRPNSGIVSDQVVLQHVGGEGRVFSFVALAMPDHLHKLFSLMCFQCPTPVASNVWLPLPHGFKVARPQTYI